MADAGRVAANALLHGNTSHAAPIANATLHCNASHAVQLITPLYNKAGQAVTIHLPQGILLPTSQLFLSAMHVLQPYSHYKTHAVGRTNSRHQLSPAKQQWTSGVVG